MSIKEEIRASLFAEQDIKYRDFHKKLIPTVEPEHIIGVRTPKLRALAREYGKRKDIGGFLEDVPHTYFDENQLHAFIIERIKDYDACVEEVERFLPYVDNWATCDQMSPKAFKKHLPEIEQKAYAWMNSEHTYTVRYGIGILMEHFLDAEFDVSQAEAVAALRSEEYYVKMMAAWYFATALAKQYEAVLPFLLENKMDEWTHNKAIQKAVESNRIDPETKKYLRTLKRGNRR